MNVETERCRMETLREISPAESFGEALSRELRARQRVEAPEGTVILFDLRFSRSGKGYTYAALWRDGQWWLTGNLNNQRTLSMQEMLDVLAGEGVGTATNVRVVTETKEV